MQTQEQQGQKPIPLHWVLDELFTFFEIDYVSLSYEQALMNYIEVMLVTNDFRRLEDGVYFVASMLNEYNIGLNSKAGIEIMATFVEHAKLGVYGNINKPHICQGCGRRYRPNLSLAWVWLVLIGQDVCPACSQNNKASYPQTTALTIPNQKANGQSPSNGWSFDWDVYEFDQAFIKFTDEDLSDLKLQRWE